MTSQKTVAGQTNINRVTNKEFFKQGNDLLSSCLGQNRVAVITRWLYRRVPLIVQQKKLLLYLQGGVFMKKLKYGTCIHSFLKS